MKNFNYFLPTEIRFGIGRIAEAGEVVKHYGSRCLLVTGPSSSVLGEVYAKVIDDLERSGVKAAHFDQVVPNPTTDTVYAGAEMAREHKAEIILGIGGGSSLDTAKAIAVEATHKGTCWDYLFFRDTQPTEKTLPVVAVPTTSGSGSHVTQVAVVTNTKEENKSALYNSILFPKVSIVDPELMLTMPAHITACTGFDVFAHAFESLINSHSSPYTDLLSLEAIRIVAADLPAAVKNGGDINERVRMAWADTLAGFSIANAGVTLPHGIGMAVGGIYPHVQHGKALAAVYPEILRFSYPFALEKFARVGRIFNPELKGQKDAVAAEKLCDILDDFLKKIGMYTNLEELNVPEKEIAALAKASMVLPDYKNHPKVATLDEIRELLNKSYKR